MPGSGRQAAAGRAGAAESARAAAQPPVPRTWLQLSTLLLSLGGLGVSVYLTIAHYTSSAILACSDQGVVNCAKVTTSPESVIFGIFPVAVLGLAFYVLMAVVNSPWAWRARSAAIWRARLGAIITGMIFVLYLIYAELIEIGNICLWCTSVHVLTFLLFALLVFNTPLRSAGSEASRPGTGAGLRAPSR